MSGTVATDSVAALGVQREIQFFGEEGETSSRASPASHSRIVDCAGNGIGGSATGWKSDTEGTARIKAVPETAQDAYYFIMAPTRIRSNLKEEVGRSI